MPRRLWTSRYCGKSTRKHDERVSAPCDAGEHKATRQRNEQRLNVASNKTLIGIGEGDGASIRGAGLPIEGRHYTRNSQHIWLDHLLLKKISDGYVDIGSGSSVLEDFITLSYVHFNGRTAYLCGGHHDNGHVTYHHKSFANGPRCVLST